MIYWDANLITNHVLSEAAVTLACSGGVDSVAGSHYMVQMFGDKVKFDLLYVNNQAVPQDDLVADKLAHFSKSLNIPFTHTLAPIKQAVSNVEAICRAARLDAFRNNGGTLVLFHHLDDAVESYLMNCLRGHETYLPIPTRTKLTVPDIDERVVLAKVVRPFLATTTKQDFEEYANKHDLMKFVVQDPLNQESFRGIIRDKIRPILGNRYTGLYSIIRKRYSAGQSKYDINRAELSSES